MGANRKSAIEWLIEAVPALSLGAAAAFAAAMAVPFAAAVALGAVAAGGAWACLARIGAAKGPALAFEPVDLPEPVDAAGLDELLLDQPVVAAVEEPSADSSRVVRLFGTGPLPAPGELANRITDFLEGGRSPPLHDASPPAAPDAGAALHAALADIRRSLG